MSTTADTSSTADTGLDAAQAAFERILDRQDGTPERKKTPEAEAPAKAEAAADDLDDETKAEDEGDEPEAEADDEEEGDAEAKEDGEDDDEPPAKVTVKIDGKSEELPLDEVIKGYQRQADYSRKTEALAHERRSFFEQEVAPVREERQQYATLLSALQQQLEAAASQEPDWDRLWADDPIEWVRQRELKKDRETKISAAKFEQQRLQAQQTEEQGRTLTKHLQSEKQRLTQLVPEAADPAKWEPMRQEIRQYAMKLGYSADEIAQAYDARAISAMVKAMKYDKLMSAKKPMPDPVKAAPAVQQGRSVAPKAQTQFTRAKQRLARSGKLSDAAAVFEGLI